MPYEKVGDNDPVCIADEVPFEIPESWEWCRLNTISYLVGNKNNQIKTVEIKKVGKVPVVSQGQALIDGYSDDIHKIINDLPLIMFGDHTKNIKYIDFPFIIGADGTKFHKIIFCDIKFIYYWMSYITINMLNRGYARHHALLLKEFLPLPPLREQEKIVCEIEKYLPLIDKYDSLETEFNKLNAEFPEKLKKSILQQAIKGKLVEQDKNDEPASVLLDKIRKEKEKLIKEGKIKKDKNESIIYKRDNSYYEKLNGVEKCIDDEIPFEIPESWEWCRFNSIVNYHMGKTPPRKDSKYWDNAKHNWISIADMIPNGIISSTKEKVNDYSVEKIFKNQITKKGTLIMSFKLTVGRVSILDIDAYHNEAIISIYPYNNANNVITNFLFKFLPLLTTFGDAKTAIKGNTLNSSSINSLLIPLPPITEQNKIIVIVNQLFSCIDNYCIYK